MLMTRAAGAIATMRKHKRTPGRLVFNLVVLALTTPAAAAASTPGFAVHQSTPGAAILYMSNADCATVRAGRVSLMIAMPHWRDWALRTPCDDWAQGPASYGPLSVVPDLYQGASGLRVRVRGHGNDRWVYPVMATQPNHVLLQWTIVTRRQYEPAHRAWQGSDEFVNYCVNENAPIYSRGGRLYCNVPAFAFNRLRVIKGRAGW